MRGGRAPVPRSFFLCCVARALSNKVFRGRARLPSTYDVLKCAAENIFNRDERFEFLDYALFGIGLKVVPLLHQHTPPMARGTLEARSELCAPREVATVGYIRVLSH